MADLKIQRAIVDVTTTTGTVTLASLGLDDVASTSSAFVVNTGNRHDGGGTNGDTSNKVAMDMAAAVYLSSTSQLTFVKAAGDDTRVSIEIWEYTGSGGGDNEFIVRGRNVVTLGTTVSSNTGTVSSTPSSIDDCVPFITGKSVSSHSGSQNEDSACYAYLSSTATLNVARSGTDIAMDVYVTTVEFTGANWSVGHGIITSFSANSGSITLNTAAAGTGGSTFDTGDWGTAAWVAWGSAPDAGFNRIANGYPALSPNATTSVVDYTFHSNHTGTDVALMVHVLQHDDLVVTRFSDTGSSTGEDTIDITSAGLTSLVTASALGTSTSSGTGTAYGRGWRNHYLNSTTQAATWCHRSGNTCNHQLQVIDWEGVTSASGQTLTGSVFGSGPSFISGLISIDQILIGSVFGSPPTFTAGTLSQGFNLMGTVFEQAPSFITGNIIVDQLLTGVLFSIAPTFVAGTLAAPLGGANSGWGIPIGIS